MQRVLTEQRPIAIDNYAAVRRTPVVLALLLGAMATATLTHLVVSVVRRRRRVLAVCAALGMRRTQLRSAVVLHAVLVAAVSVAVAVPIGLALGRLAWTTFATEVGVVDTLRPPIGTIGLAALAVVVLAVAVAAVPAVVATRSRPASMLHTE